MSAAQVHEEYEEEDILIFLDIDGLVATESLDINASAEPFFKIMGLDTDTPFMQIGTEYFTGEHTEAIGSTLLFEADDSSPQSKHSNEPPLRYFGKTCKHVSMRRAFLHKKNKAEAENIPRPSYLDDELMEVLPEDMVSDYLTPEQREARQSARVLAECSDERGKAVTSQDPHSSTVQRDLIRDSRMDEPRPGPSWAEDDGVASSCGERVTVRPIVEMKEDLPTAGVSKLGAEQSNLESKHTPSGISIDLA